MGSTEVEGRLLTHILDDLAQKTPTALYCTHPTSQDGKHDWRNITVHDFAQAVDRLAWWIDQKLDGQREQQVLAYIGTNDLRYAAFMLACMKTGHAVRAHLHPHHRVRSDHIISRCSCRREILSRHRDISYRQPSALLLSTEVKGHSCDPESMHWKPPVLIYRLTDGRSIQCGMSSQQTQSPHIPMTWAISRLRIVLLS